MGALGVSDINMDHMSRPQSSVHTSQPPHWHCTASTGPESPRHAALSGCKSWGWLLENGMESLVLARGRLLRLDHALDHARDPAVTGEHGSCSTRPCPRVACCRPHCSGPAPCSIRLRVSRPRYCLLQSSSAERVLTTGHLRTTLPVLPVAATLQLPPPCQTRTVAKCHWPLSTFKYYSTLYLSSVCRNSLSSGVLISQDEGWKLRSISAVAMR